jgi:hypothetical protein
MSLRVFRLNRPGSDEIRAATAAWSSGRYCSAA